ncbi:MAG TPA: MFS transporter [Acidimicrobiales bacterium]|nr:MFS transporter [Acidimicrobiales bacterium]
MTLTQLQARSLNGSGAEDPDRRADRAGAAATTDPSAPADLDPRRWKALPVVLSATFMSLFDIFVVNVAAPSIQHDLRASSSILEMVVAGYSFSYASGLVTGARLGDLFGRRRMFTLGLGIFAMASLVAGIAPTSAILIAARLAQGFGAAAMIPQVLALLTVNFAPHERPRVFSLFGVTVGLGTVAGQILGGVLLHLDILGWGWRPIFLVNVPIGLGAIVLARRLLSESRPDQADRLDPLGVALLTVGVGAITAPLVLGQSEHWPAWTWISFAVGSALLGSFLWWEHRLGQRGGHPLLPLDLFEHRAFNSGLLVNLGFFSFFGSVLLTLTIFLQEGLRYSPMHAGLTFAPLGVAFALSSLRGRTLHARYGTAVITAGAAAALLGVVGLTIVVTVSGLSATSLELSPVLAMIGIGNGLVIPLIVQGVLQSVPPHATGAASGMLTTTQQFSMVLGIAAVGTLFFARDVTSGIVSALQYGLFADVGLVAFALAMTFLLPRAATEPVPVTAAGAPDDAELDELAVAELMMESGL